MRHRRPDSVCESFVTVKRVRIGRSIWCRTLPPFGGCSDVPRRGGRRVLLTAFALQGIHGIDGHEIVVDEVLDNASRRRRLGYAYVVVAVCALASSHAITSSRLYSTVRGVGL